MSENKSHAGKTAVVLVIIGLIACVGIAAVLISLVTGPGVAWAQSFRAEQIERTEALAEDHIELREAQLEAHLERSHILADDITVDATASAQSIEDHIQDSADWLAAHLRNSRENLDELTGKD